MAVRARAARWPGWLPAHHTGGFSDPILTSTPTLGVRGSLIPVKKLPINLIVSEVDLSGSNLQKFAEVSRELKSLCSLLEPTFILLRQCRWEEGKPGAVLSLAGCPAKTSWQTNQRLKTKQADRTTQTPQKVDFQRRSSRTQGWFKSI